MKNICKNFKSIRHSKQAITVNNRYRNKEIIFIIRYYIHLMINVCNTVDNLKKHKKLLIIMS